MTDKTCKQALHNVRSFVNNLQLHSKIVAYVYAKKVYGGRDI